MTKKAKKKVKKSPRREYTLTVLVELKLGRHSAISDHVADKSASMAAINATRDIPMFGEMLQILANKAVPGFEPKIAQVVLHTKAGHVIDVPAYMSADKALRKLYPTDPKIWGDWLREFAASGLKVVGPKTKKKAKS